MKKTTYINIIIILSAFLINCGFFLINIKPNIHLLKDNSFNIFPLSDSMEGGNSSCSIYKKNNKLIVESKRKAGYESPYTGIIFEKKDHSYFNLNNYKIIFSIESNFDVSLPVTLYCFQPELTIENKIHTYRIFSNNNILKQGRNNFELPISSINNTPDWWYVKNKRKEEEIHQCKPTQVLNFRIITSKSLPLGTTHQLQFIKIDLIFDTTSIYPYYYLTGAITLILLFFINFKKKIVARLSNKNIVTKILIPILPSEIDPDKISTNTNKILQFLAENYGNSYLTVQYIASQLGIHERTISKLIKKHSGLNFKTYINNLRLEESKRLLKNNSLTISEISFKIGYNSPQSFNRVFKETYNISPSEFKNQD